MLYESTYGILKRSLGLLSRRERRRITLVVLLQISFGILDLIAVAIVGILGSLAITGVGSQKPGNRVSSVLNLLRIEDLTLQKQVAILGITAAVLMTLKTIFTVVFSRKTVFFLSRRSAAISSRLVAKVLSQSLVQLQQKSMQQSLYAVTNGVDVIAMGILNTSTSMISDVSLLLILAMGLFIVDPTVAISTFLVFAIVAFVLYKLMEVRARDIGVEQAKLGIRNNEKILEVFSSYREVVVRDRRSFYVDEISEIRMRLANLTAERTFMPYISKYVIEITLIVGALGIGALQFLTNDAPRAVAVLTVFLAASTRISPAILRLQQGAISIRASVGSAGPTLDLIDELDALEEVAKSSSNPSFNHEDFEPVIRVNDVTFSYPGAKSNAVKAVNFEVESGQVVAIVGPSGAGKTTLIDILLGVIVPNKGIISISGENPLEAISRWPGALSYVPQDIVIINGTIRENVAMGYPHIAASDELVWNALDIAQLREVVEGMEENLDASVGDRGTKLSGGQRQRLGIARALFTKPRLLVLDEATSALDGETEGNISQSIDSLKGQVSVILIAHRLSTVRSADKVIYMQGGEILSTGTFEEVRSQVPDFDKQAKLMGL
jgi:ABC-type multidrug transport system fused ATPase/permease subunit